jgi:hypothetical protein
MLHTNSCFEAVFIGLRHNLFHCAAMLEANSVSGSAFVANIRQRAFNNTVDDFCKTLSVLIPRILRADLKSRGILGECAGGVLGACVLIAAGCSAHREQQFWVDVYVECVLGHVHSLCVFAIHISGVPGM